MIPLRWVHLSDIHFYGDRKPENLLYEQKSIVLALKKDLLRMARVLGAPDLILLTGDVAFSADAKKEYPAAQVWLNGLLHELGIDRKRLLLVPGNHDVERGTVRKSPVANLVHKELRANPQALDQYLENEETQAVFRNKFAAFAEFARNYGGMLLDSTHPFARWQDPLRGGGLTVLGLNSALLCMDDHDEGNLALGQRQLLAVSEENEQDLLLVLVHHPPQWLRDGADLKNRLRGQNAILFSGHVHSAEVLLSSPWGDGAPLHFQAGACFGESPWTHGYSWGKIDASGLSYYPRRFEPQRHEFVDAAQGKGRRRISPKINELGDYLSIPLKQLPEGLQAWIRRQKEASLPNLDPPLVVRNRELEEEVLGDQVDADFQSRHTDVHALRQQERYEDAQQALSRMEEEAARKGSLAQQPAQQLRFRTWGARFRITRAICLMEAEQRAKARDLALKVVAEHEKDSTLLPVRSRVALAAVLASLELGDVAERVFPLSEERATLSEKDQADAESIDQQIRIELGEVPEPLTDPWLISQVGRKLLLQGDAAQAVRLVLGTLIPEAMDRRSSALRYNLLLLLTDALGATIWEYAGLRHGVERGDRKRVLRILEQHFGQAGASEKRSDRNLVLKYLSLTEQSDRFSKMCSEQKEDIEKEPNPDRAGGAPSEWWKEFTEIMRQGHKASEERRDALSRLLERYPGRVPILFELANCLANMGRAKEALPLARAAFVALPGPGQRLLLARCLLNRQRFRRSLCLLRPLSDQNPAVLRIRAVAMAADPQCMVEAIPLLERSLEQRDDASVRFALAQTLARMGEATKAAAAAWQALKQFSPESLTPKVLLEIAQLQPLSGERQTESCERIKKVIRQLEHRFPESPEVGRARLLLLSRLGFPSDHALDLEKLADQGVLQRIAPEQGISHLLNQAQLSEHLHGLYRRGLLPFEAFCELTHSSPATYLTHVMRNREPGMLCPPLLFGEQISRIGGSHLLCGELELLLLCELSLIGTLAKTLRDSSGKLLLFQDVIDQIRNKGIDLQRGLRMIPRDRGKGAAIEEEAAEAAHLAQRLQQVVAEGQEDKWIQPIKRPDLLPELPLIRMKESPELWEGWVRKPLARALAYHRALGQDPRRLLLSADLLGANPMEPVEVLIQSIDFGTEERYSKLRQTIQGGARVIGLPRLAALLAPSNLQKQETLLLWGFQETLVLSGLLFHLARRYRGQYAQTMDEFLRQGEWRAAQRDHAGRSLARAHLGQSYGGLIWTAFCTDALPDLTMQQEFAQTLLSRCDALDGGPGPRILDLALEHVALCCSDRPATAVRRAEGSEAESHEVSDQTPMGQLWHAIQGWASPSSRWRAAVGQALRTAWLDMDDHQDAPDADVRSLALLMASVVSGRRVDGIYLDSPEIGPVAILSSNWPTRPLALYDIEQTLARAAVHLSGFVQKPQDIPWNESIYAFPDADLHRRLSLPAEAVLLRANAETASFAAPRLARFQAIHDARAFHLLMQLAEQPDSPELRRRYARLVADAPWRRVREDPTHLLTWGGPHLFPHQPVDLDDLRDILGEPVLDPAAPTMLDALLLRTKDELHSALIWRAIEVPGGLSRQLTGLWMKPEYYAQAVERSLDHLSRSEEQPAGGLCADLLFLRVATARQPQVTLSTGPCDLREILPGRLVEVLRAVSAPRPLDRTTLADVESSLLRLCAQVVIALAGQTPLLPREGLWLSYRLYQWLWDQVSSLSEDERSRALADLEKVAPPPIDDTQGDLLDPRHMGPGRIDLRLLSVLYGISAGVQLVSPEVGQDTFRPALLDLPVSMPTALVSSPALEARLAEIATRPLSRDEQTLRKLSAHPSCLDWDLPAAAPDVALDALLRLSGGRGILLLPASARLRWISQIPHLIEDTDLLEPKLVSLFVDAAGDNCQALTDEECRALHERLASSHLAEYSPLWRLFFYSGLVGGGQIDLAEELEALIVDHLDQGGAPAFFGRYLTGLSFKRSSDFLSATGRIFARASEEQKPQLLWGLGHVILHGSQDGKAQATSLLLELAEAAPWRGHPSVLQLLHLLGLSSKLSS